MTIERGPFMARAVKESERDKLFCNGFSTISEMSQGYVVEQ
jgi:hypothetical protein